MTMASNTTVPIFISWSGAQEDRYWFLKIRASLDRLKPRYQLTYDDAHSVSPGLVPGRIRQERFERARLIVLIVTPEFLTAEDCMRDAREALAKQQRGQVRVMPIYARETFLKSTILEGLQLLPEVPLGNWRNRDAALRKVDEALAAALEELQIVPGEQSAFTSQDLDYLNALIADWRPVVQRRLEDFVGRERELKAVRQEIASLQDQGGYLAIVALAGEGKSSLIAQLIAEESQRDQEVVAYFLPWQPGPDGEIDLLHHLLASLVRKHRLSIHYAEGEGLPRLRQALRSLLAELGRRGIREVIYIDGLDQLEPELGGGRELSWLPEVLPVGIVFVLGLRPDDTLLSLRMGRRLVEYQLPHLSLDDFRTLLDRQRVRLSLSQIERGYRSLQGNALYLGLLARELAQQESPDHIEEVLQRIESDPAGLFRVALDRLRRDLLLWENLFYPLLAVLVVAQEPLSEGQLRSILKQTHERCQMGLQRLGGLLARDGRGGYELYHLKLRSYLQGDEQSDQRQGQSDTLFAPDEIAAWHARLADWCAGENLLAIWQAAPEPLEQERRQYARRHFIRHLYLSGLSGWQQLFSLLDAGRDRWPKLERNDGGGWAFVRDLDLGRYAAGWEGWQWEAALGQLPRLWAYTLLRCLLASRANGYPPEAFRLLVALENSNNARELAALITEARWRVAALLAIAYQLSKQGVRREEWLQLYREIEEQLLTLSRQDLKNSLDGLYRELAMVALAAGERLRAGQAAAHITDGLKRAEALLSLAESWLTTGETDQAQQHLEEACELLRHGTQQVSDALWGRCALLFRELGQHESAEEALSRVGDALERARYHLALGCFYEAQGQVDRADHEWEQMEQELWAVKSNERKAEVRLKQAERWLQLGTRTRARALAILDELEHRLLSGGNFRLWRELALTWARAGRWEKVAQIEQRLVGTQEYLRASLELALVALESGERQRAIQTWQRVRPAIDLLAESWRWPILRLLARSLAEPALLEELMALIDRARSPAEQDQLWQEVRAPLLQRLPGGGGQALGKIFHWKEARQRLPTLISAQKARSSFSQRWPPGDTSSKAKPAPAMHSLWNGIQPPAASEQTTPPEPLPSLQKQLEKQLRRVQRDWREASTLNEARERFALIAPLLASAPRLAAALQRACDWVEGFMHGQKRLPSLSLSDLEEQPTSEPPSGEPR